MASLHQIVQGLVKTCWSRGGVFKRMKKSYQVLRCHTKTIYERHTFSPTTRKHKCTFQISDNHKIGSS